MDRTRKIVLSVLALALFSSLSFFNVLLFHTLVEIITVVVAFSIFVIAWNSREFNENHFLGFVGIAYLFIGVFDLFHALSYKNMGIFPANDANLPTQFWIIARYMESVSILLALAFMNRPVKYRALFSLYSFITVFLFIILLYFGAFPDCFVEGKGLTQFKVLSEYLISVLLGISIVRLYQMRQKFDTRIFHVLIASLIFTIASELFFTFYVSVFGLSNIFGHILKLCSFYLIYYALIETGFREPFSFLFKELSDHKDELEEMLEQKDLLNREIHHRVKNNLLIITSLLKLQERQMTDKSAQDAFAESQSRIKAISLIHESLYASDDVRNVDMTKYIKKLTNAIFSSFKVEGGYVRHELDIDPVEMDVNVAIPCGLILNELITNSIKHACQDRDIFSVRIALKDDPPLGYIMVVSDNGPGLPEGFDIDNTDSFGMDIIKSLVTQIEGEITFSNNPGAEFLISIPHMDMYS